MNRRHVPAPLSSQSGLSSACNKKIISWRSRTNPASGPFATESCMNLSPIRPALLPLALIVALAACSGNDAGAPVADAGTAPLPGAADAGGERTTAQITGAGATFIYPLLSKWSDDYHKATGARINYQWMGSGGGIAQIRAGPVAFGSTDKPLPPEE